ncbi:Leucine carboxyl methyltransferase 2 [Nesidiocoris tenuis]|uniref:tRNA wybutosine-synthesizing protein 4 n=1 Tax=Nesidiocoris tenuis TaxID=355587 RepID=A0ABN7AAB4_9HEMI|nr:Leucine carboxyl methyltransferase 2 [Nesidiocoris tenuis]
MDTLVQQTNSSSIVSKRSMISNGYFKDDFIHHFVPKHSRRSPLIHLGYFVRALSVDNCIRTFLDGLPTNCSSQILSLGAGYDTTFFRLCSERLNLVYFEVDLSDVVANKIKTIKESIELKSLLVGCTDIDSSSTGMSLSSKNYNIFSHDLSDVTGLETKLKALGFDNNRHTLVFSECAITYMDEDRSTDLIRWAATTLPYGSFMNYEQVNPDDGFGHVMLEHFSKIQNPLKSVAKYKTLEEQRGRYLNAGWTECKVVSVARYVRELLASEEYVNMFKHEPFDEWEEFHLKCCHYSVAYADHCSSHSSVGDGNRFQPKKIEWPLCQSTRFERFGHASVPLSDGGILSFGGFGIEPGTNRHTRCNELSYTGIAAKNVNMLFNRGVSVTLDCLYATVTSIGNNDFILFGGRTSPTKEVNCEPVLVHVKVNQTSIDVTFEKITFPSETPTPPNRWRHTASDLHGSTFVFGGRNKDLKIFNDLWELKRGENTWQWVQRFQKSGSWPEGRFSHAATTGQGKIYVSGGLNADLTPMDDLWELELKDDDVRWSKLETVGLLPASYNHTIHFYSGRLISIGGVNESDWIQPGLTIIDLASLHVQHYTYQIPPVDPGLMLHGHSSVLNEEEGAIYVQGGGGNCFSFGTHLNKYVAKLELFASFSAICTT